jgi:hypothetical protein
MNSKSKSPKLFQQVSGLKQEEKIVGKFQLGKSKAKKLLKQHQNKQK